MFFYVSLTSPAEGANVEDQANEKKELIMIKLQSWQQKQGPVSAAAVPSQYLQHKQTCLTQASLFLAAKRQLWT